MTETITPNITELEAKHSACLEELAAAKQARDTAQSAWRVLNARLHELESNKVIVEQQLGDELINFYGGTAKTKPNARALTDVRAEIDLLSIATRRAFDRMPELEAAWLQSEARALLAEADVERAHAAIEEAEALNALEAISGSLGRGAAVELQNTVFQQRIRHAGELVEEAARLRKRATEAFGGGKQ